MPILGFMRLRRLEQRLEQLQALTYTFTDASTRLSKAFEQASVEPENALVRSEASRRTLIHSARNQLDEGASVDRLTVQTGVATRRTEADGYRPPCGLCCQRTRLSRRANDERLVDQFCARLPMVRVLQIATEERAARIEHRRIAAATAASCTSRRTR